MMDLYASTVSFNGKQILTFAHLTVSHEYRHFVNTAFELQGVDLSDLKDRELKAFFLNVYNTLFYHTAISISVGLLKVPDNDYQSWGKTGYIINGQKYSLHDIEHGILRGNRKASKRKIKVLLSKHDPRAKFITSFDPKIYFALVRGSKSNPVIPIFHPLSLDLELQMCSEGMLEDEIEIDKSKNIVTVPKIFYYYGKDFGKNESSIVKWISESMTSTCKKKEELESLLSHKISLKYLEDHFLLEGGTFIEDYSNLDTSSDSISKVT